MDVFSRSFIRKRAIALATTVSVAAISLVLAHGPTSAHLMHTTIPVQYVSDRSNNLSAGNSGEASFMSESESAMSRMISGMAVKPTGDIDRDFETMMIPHHQGAIDMAQAELRYGHNELLRRLAREIIRNQQQEITVMRLAVDDERPLPADSSVQAAPPASDPPTMSHETMGAPQ
jgi:uncharacterized protein (DUF305 family)